MPWAYPRASGEHPTAVWNERINPLYQVKTVGEVSRDGWAAQQLGGYPAAAVRNVQPGATLNPMSEAFESAKAGGKNHGLYVTHSRLSNEELAKSIRSFEKQISKHQSWVSDPTLKIEGFYGFDPRRQAALIVGWGQDISRHKESIEIVQGILQERNK